MKINSLNHLSPSNNILIIIFTAVLIISAGCKSREKSQPAGEAATEKQKQEIIAGQEESAKQAGLPKAATEQKKIVKNGDTVRVQYIGTFKDGTVFDRSKDGQPLSFVVGSGQVIPGFEKAVAGMRLNEGKKITIPAAEAYGQKQKEMIREYPRASLPANINPEKGMVLNMKDKEGRIMPATIVDVNKEKVVLDLNHPLSGKDLCFDIKVVGIQ
jgi:peptidylprolyl isomerase